MKRRRVRGWEGFSVINKRTLWYVRPPDERLHFQQARSRDAFTFWFDARWLRERIVVMDLDWGRQNEKTRRGTTWTEKDICIVFSSCFRRSSPPLPTNVHPTFMPMKQLELKHRGSDGEKLGGREAERSLPMWLTFCFSCCNSDEKAQQEDILPDSPPGSIVRRYRKWLLL